jgi:hypothetical protein
MGQKNKRDVMIITAEISAEIPLEDRHLMWGRFPIRGDVIFAGR